MTSPRTLASILREIGAAMDNLLDLSSRKTQVLIGGDVAGLEGLLSVEQDLIQRIRLLEEERMVCSGVPATEPAGEVSEIKQSLRDKAKRITEANGRNQRLLRQGLEVVRRELKILFPQGNYGSPAAVGPLVFDHRV